MNPSALRFHAFVAFFSVFLALFAWYRSHHHMHSDAIFFDFSLKDIVSIHFQDLEHDVVLNLLNLKTKIILNKAEHKSNEIFIKNEFNASKQAEEYLTFISPLRAIRLLGKVSDEKWEEFLLKKSSTYLKIQTKFETKNYVVGSVHEGNASVYLGDQKTHEVALVSPRVVSMFEHGGDLLQNRHIINVSESRVQSIQIKYKDDTKNVKVFFPDVPSKKYYVDIKNMSYRLIEAPVFVQALYDMQIIGMLLQEKQTRCLIHVDLLEDNAVLDSVDICDYSDKYVSVKTGYLDGIGLVAKESLPDIFNRLEQVVLEGGSK